MWKKTFKPQKQNLIKSSEKRKLKEKILTAFPGLSAEALDQLMPNKEDIHEVKITGSKTIVYTRDNEPLFFDLDARGNFFPTVYALWKLPPFMPTFDVHPAVFKYIARGADLMLPGVVPPPGGYEPFNERQKRVVTIAGTKTAVGIGITQCSSESIAKNGMKGKGLLMTHFYTDFLWRWGPKTHPKLDFEEGDDDFDEEAEIDDGDAAEAELAQAMQQATLDTPAAEPLQVGEASPSESSNSNPEVATQPDSIPADAQEAAPQSAEAAGQAGEDIPVEVMDALILLTFLQALKRRVKDTDLPMLASAFYSQIYLPCRPVGSNINFKKSSFKKFNTFLQQKAEEKMIEIDEPQEGVMRIVAVDKNHEALAAFRPLPVSATVEGVERAAAEKEDDDTDSGPQIKEAWQLPKVLSFLIPEDRAVNDMFDLAECTAMLWAYVAEHELNDPTDRKLVNLDQNMAMALFEGLARAAGPFGKVTVDKAALAKKFRDRLVKVNEVTIDGIKQIKKGELGKIQVIVEPRQGRKWMTRVQGLHQFGIDPKEIAKICPKKFAASASVAKLAGKAGSVTMEVLIQGSFGDEVQEVLISEFNVPAKYVELSGAGAKGPKRK